MKYGRLGRTGLEISRLCLGCMSFGIPDRGRHVWTLPEPQARPVIQHAVEAGINMFDVANVYSDGTAEEIVGRALRDFCRREEIVIATKVQGRMRSGPNGAGLSRKAIIAEAEASLKRLGTDYIDLYQIHRFDPATPVEETLEALHDLVRAGKVRYLGACSMAAWRFVDMVRKAEAHGWTPFVSMQNYHNLLYREEEREMLPFCAENGIGVLPWSPLARGRLARLAETETPRSREDEYGRELHDPADRSDRDRIALLSSLAQTTGRPMAQLALAWLLGQGWNASPIIGVSNVVQLNDAIASVDLEIEPADMAALSANYVPHPVVGFN